MENPDLNAPEQGGEVLEPTADGDEAVVERVPEFEEKLLTPYRNMDNPDQVDYLIAPGDIQRAYAARYNHFPKWWRAQFNQSWNDLTKHLQYQHVKEQNCECQLEARFSSDQQQVLGIDPLSLYRVLPELPQLIVINRQRFHPTQVNVLNKYLGLLAKSEQAV